MGTTVTTGKAVKAFRTKSDKVIYVLFEEAYEKNCHPHTPTWECFAIGEYKDVMKRVFGRAASAEGGALNNRSGDLTPESYLRGWKLAFNKPMRMRDEPLTVKILDRKEWVGGITSVHAGALLNLLQANDRLDVWESLINEQVGQVSMSFHDDGDLISAIFGVGGIEAPWKIIDTYGKPSGVEDITLIPKKHNQGKIPPDMNRLVKFSGKHTDYYAEMNAAGTFSNPKWAYSVMASYVANQAYECEMLEAGLGVKNIQTFREVLASEPDSTEDFEAFIDKSTVAPDMVKQFEYNLGISFDDAPDVYQLPSVTFALENVAIGLKVYYKRKQLVKNKSSNLFAA